MTLMERMAAVEAFIAELKLSGVLGPRVERKTPGTAIGDHRDAFRQMVELHREAESIERHSKASG